jgi:hypothetical protein
MTLGLLKRYGLHTVPISGESVYKASYAGPIEPNMFEAGVPALLDTLAGLPKEDLEATTIRQLLVRLHGASFTDRFLDQFPYRAEVEVMRADMALQLFRGEMRSQGGFSICKEGLSELVRRLRADIEKRGGDLKGEYELVGWTSIPKEGLKAEFRVGPASEGVARPSEFFSCRHLILAIPALALKELAPLKGWKGLKRLQMEPLLRFYGVFPEAVGGLSTKLITPTPIRFMIPGGPGVYQMSYTDSRDARYWIEKLDQQGEKKVGEEILAELRRLVEPTIPPPKLVKAHAWRDGATYWLPGHYDPAVLSKEAYTPLASQPGLHVCGESFSLRQAWIEGALEHADGLLRQLLRAPNKLLPKA